jgi:hypothetical protein
MKVEEGGVHCKKTMVIAQNNGLEFQKLFKHHPL